MVTLADLPTPVVSLRYTKPWGKDAAESIYLFDQEAAKAGFVYHAEYSAQSSRWFAFLISVNEQHADATRQIIDKLNPKRTGVRSARFSGWWTAIEPTRLSKAHQDHPWTFAAYHESGRQREDGQRYTAFLFRNDDRTAFGVREWLGNDVLVTNAVLEKMAHRVVTEVAFRNSLLSDDPDLPLLWKKR
jgi:hypothetical protein